MPPHHASSNIEPAALFRWSATATEEDSRDVTGNPCRLRGKFFLYRKPGRPDSEKAQGRVFQCPMGLKNTAPMPQ